MANTKTILGFIAGAAIGAIAGILLAPDSGKNTREYISGKLNKAQGDIEEGVNTTGDPNVANMSSGAL